MSISLFYAAFSADLAVKLAIVFLLLGYGLSAHRRLGVVAPLWLCGATTLHWAAGFLQPRWMQLLADRLNALGPPTTASFGQITSTIFYGSDLLYSFALLMLLAVAMAELVESTQACVSWGDGKLVARIGLIIRLRSRLCIAAIALVAIGSCGPGIAILLL